jgi:membrane protein
MSSRIASSEEGRGATRPSQFRWRDWKAVLLRVYDNITYHNLFLIAAGVAFYAILALFPAIAALVALYGVVANAADIAQQLETVRRFVPADAYGLIEAQLVQLTSAGEQKLGFTSILAMLFALWSARAGVYGLVTGLNVAYSEVDERSLAKSTLLTLALTALLLVVVIAAILAIVVVPAILQIIDLESDAAWIAALVRWPILLAAVMTGIGVLYRYGPDRKQARVQWISWGSAIATGVWLLGSLLFSFYVANFANYNATYGSLGAIIGLLMWFFIGAFIVLLGAELNAELEHQTRTDTTVGRDKPMGQRGAFVADHAPGETGAERGAGIVQSDAQTGGGRPKA